MSLFGNKNEVSDTQRELEEYMKKRKEEGAYDAVDNMTNGSYSQNNNYYNPNAANEDSYQQNSANAGNGYYQQNAVNESSNYYRQNAVNQGDYQQDIANKHCPTYYHNDSDNNFYTPQDSGYQQTNYYTNQPKATGIFKHKKTALFMLICFIAVFVTATIGAKFLCLGFFGLLFCLVGIYVIVYRKSATNTNSKKHSAIPIPIPIGLIFTIIGAISFVSAVINVLHQFGI